MNSSIESSSNSVQATAQTVASNLSLSFKKLGFKSLEAIPDLIHFRDMIEKAFEMSLLDVGLDCGKLFVEITSKHSSPRHPEITVEPFYLAPDKRNSYRVLDKNRSKIGAYILHERANNMLESCVLTTDTATVRSFVLREILYRSKGKRLIFQDCKIAGKLEKAFAALVLVSLARVKQAEPTQQVEQKVELLIRAEKSGSVPTFQADAPLQVEQSKLQAEIQQHVEQMDFEEARPLENNAHEEARPLENKAIEQKQEPEQFVAYYKFPIGPSKVVPSERSIDLEFFEPLRSQMSEKEFYWVDKHLIERLREMETVRDYYGFKCQATLLQPGRIKDLVRSLCLDLEDANPILSLHVSDELIDVESCRDKGNMVYKELKASLASRGPFEIQAEPEQHVEQTDEEARPLENKANQVEPEQHVEKTDEEARPLENKAIDFIQGEPTLHVEQMEIEETYPLENTVSEEQDSQDSESEKVSEEETQDSIDLTQKLRLEMLQVQASCCPTGFCSRGVTVREIPFLGCGDAISYIAEKVVCFPAINGNCDIQLIAYIIGNEEDRYVEEWESANAVDFPGRMRRVISIFEHCITVSSSSISVNGDSCEGAVHYLNKLKNYYGIVPFEVTGTYESGKLVHAEDLDRKKEFCRFFGLTLLTPPSWLSISEMFLQGFHPPYFRDDILAIRFNATTRKKFIGPLTKSDTKKKAKRQKRRASKSTLMLTNSLRDPFKFAGCIPDGTKNKGCFAVKEMYTLLTGTGNAVSLALTPSLASNVALDSGTANNFFTLPGAGTFVQAGQYTAIVNMYDRIRMVSAAIRVHFTGSDLANQGQYVLAQMPTGTTVSSWNNNNVGNVITKTTSFQVFDNRTAATITWRPEDDEDYQFIDATTSYATLNVPVSTAPWLFFGASGVATAGAGSYLIEIIKNYEGIFGQASFSLAPSSSETDSAEPGWYEKSMGALKTVGQFVVNNAVPIAMAAQRVRSSNLALTM